MGVHDLLGRLNRVRQSGNRSQWSACCPAHDDNNPSLSVSVGEDGTILLKCLAGCTAKNICEAVGWTLADLFQEPDVVQYREADRQIGRKADRQTPSKALCLSVLHGGLCPSVLHCHVCEAIKKTAPNGIRGWKKQAFRFARRLRALPPGLIGDDVGRLEFVSRRWFAVWSAQYAAWAARQKEPCLDLPEVSDVLSEITSGYSKVNQPHGQGAMFELWDEARTCEPCPTALKFKDEPLVQQMVTFCRLLHEKNCAAGKPVNKEDGKPMFFLGCDDVAALIGKDEATASRWRERLVVHGILVLVKRWPPEARKANEYRFVKQDRATDLDDRGPVPF